MKKIRLSEGDLIRIIERLSPGDDPTPVNSRKMILKKINALETPNTDVLAGLDHLDYRVGAVLFLPKEQRDFYRSLMKDVRDQYDMYKEKLEVFKHAVSTDVKADKLDHLKRMYPYQKTYKV
jgi:hypothetical protein